VSDSIGGVVGAQNGLAEHIAEREMLLVLDNFEQIVAGAPLLASLVESCPRLSMLVTSRELLRIRGEVEFAVPPLELSKAVELFCARAGVEPTETIRELCRRLDSLPLAIELAAARTRVLSPAQILERLSSRLDLLKGGRDAEARQQTLRSTIAWSHDLLDPDEQRLFARLAVFRGGWTLEAAERVVQADIDVLQSLVEKSLVRHVDERFSMLETIREYAAERLKESGEAESLWREHAEWLLDLGRELPVDHQVSREWLDALEREQDNVRAALDRLEPLGETQLALKLAESQWRFWKTRGYTSEGRRRLEGLLAADPRPTAARAHALNAVAGLAVDTGDAETGRRQADEALAIHRQNEDAWGVARSIYMLGYAAIESGDFATARPLFEEAMQRMEDLGADHYVHMAAFNLAWTYEELGERERAIAMDEEGLQRARAAGNRPRAAASLDALGGYVRDEGRTEDALQMFRESLEINRELGDIVHVLDSLSRVASTHAVAGHAALAARLLSASLALHEEKGLSVPLYQTKRNEATLALIHEHLDSADFTRAWATGGKLTLDDALAIALDEGAA
jgi:predicted ATPase